MHAQQRISKGWPICLFITAIVLFGVGGGLLGSSVTTSSEYYDDYFYASPGMYYGGIAACALGGCALIAFIVMTIVYFARRNRSPLYAENAYNGVNYAQPQTAASYEQTAMAMTNQMLRNGEKFCSNCGSPTNGKFCSSCGTAIPDR